MNGTLRQIFNHKTYILGLALCMFLFKPLWAENLEIEASGFLEWNQENKSYIAKGDAIATQGERTIQADEIIAFYESEENRDITRIQAAGSVKFSDVSGSGYSDRLHYEMNTQTVTLNGNENYFESEEFIAQSSNQIQFNELNGILNLQDDAMISFSEARKIEAQRLEIALSDDGNVTTINAKGDVKLTEEAGRIAYSGSAFYEAENGNMTLSDSVEILDGNNQLRGDIAIINMETGYSKILAGSENKRVTGKLILGTSN
jgi:lipopolysaccharide export system protein LptA